MAVKAAPTGEVVYIVMVQTVSKGTNHSSYSNWTVDNVYDSMQEGTARARAITLQGNHSTAVKVVTMDVVLSLEPT